MDKIQHTLEQFPKDFQSAVLATMTKDNTLYTSYAPFVIVDKAYYFLMSKIAKHYENLVNNNQMSFILIEDEIKSKNIFFRRRLSYQAHAEIDVKDELVKSAFINLHKEMAEMLFQMDFIMVKANIKEGQFIIGPGMAYEVNQNQTIKEQIKPSQGHGHK
jgi:putative heme iron utilization protein